MANPELVFTFSFLRGVYAVDIAENFIDKTVSQAEEAGINNMIGIVNSHRVTGLKAGSIDLVFVCDTYHH